MADARPKPRWGEYAPESPTAPVSVAPLDESTDIAPARPRRRTWDLVLTTALLALGVYDVIAGYSTYADLAPVVQSMYDQLAVGQFESQALAAQWGLIANIARISILVIVVLVSLLLVARGRLAFWVPLAGAALAAIVVVVSIAVIISSDPAYLDFVIRQTP